MMFLPIVMVVAAGVVLLNVGFFEMNNIRPFITSNWKQMLMGVKETGLSFLGFEIVLFYAMYMNRPKGAAKASILGVILIIFLYLFIFIFCIGVFGNEVTETIIYPTVELAKEIEVPGEFFERFESLFFTIWLMTIFNTSTMAYDVGLMAFRSLIKKGTKMIYLSVLSTHYFINGYVSAYSYRFLPLWNRYWLCWTIFCYGLAIYITYYRQNTGGEGRWIS